MKTDTFLLHSRGDVEVFLRAHGWNNVRGQADLFYHIVPDPKASTPWRIGVDLGRFPVVNLLAKNSSFPETERATLRCDLTEWNGQATFVHEVNWWWAQHNKQRSVNVWVC